jgi:hypothetical protein
MPVPKIRSFQIEAIDKQIDQLICKLYGLMEEALGVVEGEK